MPSKTARDRASLCSFLFTDGRQCRMLKQNKTSQFCYFHQLHADQVDDAIEAGEQIASCLTSDFVTDCSLTAALSRTFISVARGDYDIKTARTLDYLAQLMSKTLSGQARTCPLRRPRQHGTRSRILPLPRQRKFPPPTRTPTTIPPTDDHRTRDHRPPPVA